MKLLSPILSITGSDNSGTTGIQADIRTAAALGGQALTAVTAITVKEDGDAPLLLDLPTHMITGQVRAIIEDRHPRVVKVGMVRQPDAVRALRHEIIGCRERVMVPSIMTSGGRMLLDDAAIEAWRQHLIPEASLLILRCNEAELLLRHPIATDVDMAEAARQLTDMGARAVMIRSGHLTEGQLTALLHAPGVMRFFTSHNTEGWQRHGVSGALSAAIATRLALGDGLEEAIGRAHGYLHSQVVYAVEPTDRGHRPADLFNRLMTLIATDHRTAHGVAHYADRLAVSTRYLSTVTQKVVQKSPKQVIDDYLIHEATILLAATRLSIGEIAARLGFTSTAAFSSFFAARQGHSPIAHRARLGKL